jgi:hypothetical protein
MEWGGSAARTDGISLQSGRELFQGRSDLFRAFCASAAASDRERAHRGIPTSERCWRMDKLFHGLRERFDYIVVDFSPLAPIVDVRSSIHLVDSFLYIVEWGSTKLDVVKHVLKRAHFGRDKLLGTVLNKVDMRSIGRYESYKESFYRNENYARYGYVD